MTQANLLELAKQGNPQAIAALMNLVLEPKGVTAKTQLQDDCLHIVFTSEHTLSQSAIAGFVRNGLSTLGTASFQRVKLYARKTGQAAPLWVDSFVTSPPVMPTTAPATAPAPAPASVPPPRVQAHLPHLNPPLSAPQPPAPPPATKQRPVPTHQALLGWGKKWQQILPQFQSRLPAWGRVAQPYRVAIAVSAGAFLIGGTVALLANTQTGNTVQGGVPTSTGSTPPTTQAIVPPTPAQPNTTPEGQVEAYLTKMNQAQQAFYQTNGRFAATLEELERSAAVMSHSTVYIYRLVLRDNVQSVLTATPKQDGLSSYSGTVLPVDATQPATMATIICKTTQPSTYPPILAQATGQPILCPAEATQVEGKAK